MEGRGGGDGGVILLGGHFQNLDWLGDVIFRLGSVTWGGGCILINFLKVKQIKQ